MLQRGKEVKEKLLEQTPQRRQLDELQRVSRDKAAVLCGENSLEVASCLESGVSVKKLKQQYYIQV